MIAAPVLRFDPERHVYEYGGERIPSVTQLLEMAGLVDGSQYFTEASRDRGTAVHALCTDHDLGLVGTAAASPFVGYVKGYIAACKALKPSWESIEVIEVHPTYRFAGRPDRVGEVFGRQTVLEIKTASKAKHHAVQTALQALLVSARHPLPADQWHRLTLYLKPSGKWSVEEHTDRRDFDTALSLIRRFCAVTV